MLSYWQTIFMDEKSNILIMGAGKIGSALEFLFNQAGRSVDKWDKDPKKVPGQKDLAQMSPAADFVFLCLPTKYVRDALQSLAPYIKKETILIPLAKGLEQKTALTLPEIINQALPKQPVGLLAGPMLAEELRDGHGGAAVIASVNAAWRERIAALFVGSDLRLFLSNDLRGVALASALKNIYAMAFGIAAGLEWGDNRRGWLLSACLWEMFDILPRLGGRPETALSLAGLGDLIATGSSPYSSNREFGRQLLAGHCDARKEGCLAFPSLKSLLADDLKSYPVLTALDKIISQQSEAAAVFKALADG